MNTIIAVALAYLFGAIPSGVIVGRVNNVDLQKSGSGNTGATNMLRNAGWGPALIVALADVFKGALAVIIARALNLPDWELSLVVLAVILGHNYSVFLGFRGGKGVAASMGALMMLDPGIAGAVFSIFVATVLVTRFVSAGSIVASFASVVFALALAREPWTVVNCMILFGTIALKHRDNLGRMYAGIERRIDQRNIRATPDGDIEISPIGSADNEADSEADSQLSAEPAPALAKATIATVAPAAPAATVASVIGDNGGQKPEA
jgi:acyl phosphate:glycerol-3-phosphate acyltransferase